MTKITLQIDGMMCPMCAAHIADALRNAFSPKKVSVSNTAGCAVLIVEQDIGDEELRRVVDGTGYTLCAVAREPYTKKGLFSFLRRSDRG